jgi:hypothetical protein
MLLYANTEIIIVCFWFDCACNWKRSQYINFYLVEKHKARTQFDSIRSDTGYLDVVIFSSYSNLMEGDDLAAVECIAAVL